MKKALLFALGCLLIITQKVNAQGYTFSKSTGTYTPITGGTAFAANSTINLPFDVTINGVKNDTLHISSYFGAISTKKKSGVFNAFIAEIQDGTKTYSITGTAGNRIIKLQFDQHKFSHLTWKSDYVTLQIWVYEKDNALELHMGSSSVPEPDLAYYFHSPEGPAIGLKNMWLVGTPSNPTIDTSTGETYMNGTPANGQIYRFEPSANSISNTQKHNSSIAVYPNPANNKVQVSWSKALKNPQLSITDISGKEVFSKEIDQQTKSVEVTLPNIPAGTYLLNIHHNEGVVTERLLIE